MLQMCAACMQPNVAGGLQVDECFMLPACQPWVAQQASHLLSWKVQAGAY